MRGDCWPLIIFSSIGSACSASVLSRPLSASSFSSSSGRRGRRHGLAHRSFHLELEGEGLLEPAAVGEGLLHFLQRLQRGLQRLRLVLGERFPVERAVGLLALERGGLRERLQGLFVAGRVKRGGALRVELQLALGLFQRFLDLGDLLRHVLLRLFLGLFHVLLCLHHVLAGLLDVRPLGGGLLCGLRVEPRLLLLLGGLRRRLRGRRRRGRRRAWRCPGRRPRNRSPRRRPACMRCAWWLSWIRPIRLMSS